MRKADAIRGSAPRSPAWPLSCPRNFSVFCAAFAV
jgi:hypothetical protein